VRRAEFANLGQGDGRVERGVPQQFRCWPWSRPDFRRGQELKQEWTLVEVENRITECTLTSSGL